MSQAKVVTWDEWAKHVNAQLKDHQNKLKNLENQLALIGAEVDKLTAASLEPKVLELLRSQNKPRTWTWIRNRLGHRAWDPLQDLIRKGLVIRTIPRKHMMYIAKES